ncbi:hypothetical protein [Microbacterium sp. LBN7]|uniref:hypothetical protein n=1 Tax=Microbacterium sp. LBN7 TaxID=3129773 RepID=UPI003251DF3D
MTELNASTEPDDDATEAARLEAIAARVVSNIDKMAEAVADEAEVTKDILATYLVHVDEDNNTKPPQREVNRLIMKSLFRLEARIIRIERKLGLEPMPPVD